MNRNLKQNINSNYKMEEKKKFEALQYSYENAGQFRVISPFRYSSEYPRIAAIARNCPAFS